MYCVSCYVGGTFSYKVTFDSPLDVAMFLDMTLKSDADCDVFDYRYIVSRDE